MQNVILRDLEASAFPWRYRLFLRQSALTTFLTLVGLVLLMLMLVLFDPRGISARAQEHPPAGLFFHGADAEMGYAAPLLKSDVVIDLEGPQARVTVRQSFQNPSDHWMEGVYVFPLPEGSAVDRLTLLVGERRIEGRILPKEEAQKVYEQAASEGRKASLLSSERANVFATAVANIGPHEKIAVEIGYQDRADFSDGTYSYRFPMVVAPRYTPLDSEEPALVSSAVPSGQEGDLFGPVSRSSHPEGNRLSLLVKLNAGFPLAEVKSLYHDMDVESLGDGRRVLTLSQGNVAPNRDFVLTWRPLPSAQPLAGLHAEEKAGDLYLLADILPPALPRPDRRELPRDMILVVDTSGSMSGPSIEQAKRALHAALDRLKPTDRFNILRFSSDFGQIFARAEPASPENLAYARRAIESLVAEGGTEMRPALEAALGERPAQGRLRQVVFLTDGAVGNEAQLFQIISQRLDRNRLFTVGIGSAPNGYFMRKAAEVGRGSFTWIGDIDEVEQQMTALLDRLARPAMTDLSLSLPEGLAASAEMYPEVLPDLYSGQPVRVAIKLPSASTGQLSGDLTLSGRFGEERWETRLPLTAITAGSGPAALWARDKVTAIEDRAYDPAQPASYDQIREEAMAVALKHGLVTRYTSLVAVDESEIARPRDEGLAKGEIARPLPEGMEADKVFGPDAAPPPAPTLDRAAFEALALEPVALPAAARAAARQSLGIPQTASPALLQALVGFLLLSGGLALLLLLRRSQGGGGRNGNGHAAA